MILILFNREIREWPILFTRAKMVSDMEEELPCSAIDFKSYQLVMDTLIHV